jgi:hypothetical protein
LFSKTWLNVATRGTQKKAGTIPWRYWIGCLRNGLVEIEGFPPFATRQESASYFATLMHAVAPAAAEVIAEYGDDRELEPVVAQTQPEPTAEERRDLARQLREDLAAQRATARASRTSHR